MESELGFKEISMDSCKQVGGPSGRTVFAFEGIKYYPDKIIGKGRNGTVVYEGTYGGDPVAVKRLPLEEFKIQLEGIRNLIDADGHRSILNTYCGFDIDDRGYGLMAMKLCDYDLFRLVQDDRLYAGLLKENGLPSPRFIQLMWDIATSLNDLHLLRIIHGDLKPSHVLMSGNEPLIAGMGSSKRMDAGKSSLGPNVTISGSIGWRSPEQIIKSSSQTPAMDVFNLGCVLFFIFTKGKHPFGDDVHEREINLANNNIVNLYLVENILVKDFLSRFLEPSAKLRPKLSDALTHPLFWSYSRRLWFLMYAAKRLKDKKSGSIVEELETKGDQVFSKMPKADKVITKMQRYAPFDFSFVKVVDLVRLIAKMMKRYMAQRPPASIEKLLGPRLEDLDNYLGSSFPDLLAVLYLVMRRHCSKEGWFLSRCK